VGGACQHGWAAIANPVRVALVAVPIFSLSRVMAFWTYMLHCRGGYFYVGHTDDLERRLKGWSRVKKMALIRGDWDDIRRAAKGKNSPSTRSGRTEGGA
jgi:putative endonuclease